MRNEKKAGLAGVSQSRRGFTKACIAGAMIGISGAKTSLGASFDNRAEQAEGWIDAHVHVWTPDLKRYPLGANYKKSDMQPQSFTPEELFQHSKPAGVTRVVLIQMSYYEYDNRYMTDVIAAYPGVFSGVAVVDHEAPELTRRVKELRDQGVRGFRIYAGQGSAAKWLESDAMDNLWRVATENGIALCPLINPSDLAVVDKFSERFPEATVVVDHFARIGIDGTVRTSDLDALCRLARFPKVFVKTSAFYALGAKKPPYEDLYPMISRVRDAFGAERLMWASDCPFQVEGEHTYRASIDLIHNAPESVLSANDKTWLLRGTAEKVFFREV